MGDVAVALAVGVRAPAHPADDDGPAAAVLDPWLVVELGGEEVLFGYAESHPATGGRSWVRSSPVAELDEEAGRARTESGRAYALGRRVAVEDLDEEGRTALRLLAAEFLGAEPLPGDDDDARWVSARKWARRLGVEAPPRDPEAVRRFLRSHEERYLALRRGRTA